MLSVLTVSNESAAALQEPEVAGLASVLLQVSDVKTQ